MKHKLPALLSLLFGLPVLLPAQQWRAQLTPHWSTREGTLNATPTYQIVASPLMRPTSPIHDRVYQNVHDLQADYARFQGWGPSPRIAVAEMEPPDNGKAHWDFSVMDPVVVDFLEATKGHPILMNLATIPEWMYKTDKPVVVPANPDKLFYEYEQGTELRDPSMKEVAEYFGRLASWYTKGGFNDEYGVWHESGHHYKIAYWEVLNEVDFEHQTTPEVYTRLYDAVVEAVRAVDPSIKFVGLAVAGTSTVPWQKQNPRYFEYFLDPKNHRTGIPIDGISYHFYAVWPAGDDQDVFKYTVFEQADRFLSTVRYIEAIREQLAPNTRSFIDELGFISGDDSGQGQPKHLSAPLPDSYWNLAAAFYAYVFNNLVDMPGIEAVGMSSGLAYPNHYYPSVTMMDWRTGQPNARYWALKLLIDQIKPGSTMVETDVKVNSEPAPPIYSNIQSHAFITANGQHKLLVVNKRDAPYEVVIAGADGGEVARIVEETASALGNINILVNNAGFCRFVPFLDVSEELWDRTMAINLKGYFLVGQAVAKQMVAAGKGGKIINISSMSAEVAGEEKVHYCASKGAIKILTQGMALELARYRINVNALAPGTIDTDIVQDEHILRVVEAERKQSSIPWGRMGTGEDLVGAAIFLASSDSDYMAGATVLVDGGCLAGSVLPPRFRAPRG